MRAGDDGGGCGRWGRDLMAPCCDLLRMGGMDKKNKNLYSS